MPRMNSKDHKPKMMVEVKGMTSMTLRKLHDYQKQGVLCDVTLNAGDKSFMCHRNVLASCSAYFQAMFTTPLAERNKKEIDIGDIDAQTLEILIDFAYTGKVEITVQNAQSLMIASSIMQLDQLATLVSDFVASHLTYFDIFEIRNMSDAFGLKHLVELADEFTLHNFKDVAQGGEFVNLSVDYLERLISSPDLFVNTEQAVIDSVLAWAKFDFEHRKDMLLRLLENIHLPRLELEKLQIMKDAEPYFSTDVKFRDYLDEAKNYQIWQVSQLHNVHLPISNRTRPRTCYAGLLYCIGGSTGGEIDGVDVKAEPLSTADMFSPFYNRWYSCKPLKVCRRHVGVALHKGNIYAVGGADKISHLSTTERYDPSTNKWEFVAHICIPRRGLGLCSMGGGIYAVGGMDFNNWFSIVERYDAITNSWKRVAPMNDARGGIAVAKRKGLLFAIGGETSEGALDICEMYDPYRDKWSYIASLNEKRSGAGIAELNGFLYVIGGFNKNTPTNTVERYDYESNTWSFVASLNAARGGVSAAHVGGLIYAIGGHDNSGYKTVVEIYDPIPNCWVYGRNLPSSRAGVGVVHYPVDGDDMKHLCENKCSILEESTV